MTTPRQPRSTARRPAGSRVAPLYDPARAARIGQGWVRRRAKGMDAGGVAAALEEARFDARQDSRHEDLAGDDRGHAELAERERLHQLLAAAAPGTVYDPDTDAVVQADLAAEAVATAAREADLREAGLSSDWLCSVVGGDGRSRVSLTLYARCQLPCGNGFFGAVGAGHRGCGG
ncbi:hypothetical protein [Streptomyces sp. NBC_01190]|uniref:hypothetical protein n=1 Tax=Streptomyces sp. NBC_01190 TaxID=2903767 RepID=UPI003867C796|nr:hypothetical protein OG519_29255 [Streptomyces sp. NBC_01190]